MRSWAGPVVIGLVLGAGFAVANNSADPESRAGAAQPTPEPDQPEVSATNTAEAEQTMRDPAPASPEPTATNREPAAANRQRATANVRSSVARGPASGVAITFDDGPHGAYTPRILEILDRYGTTAVFCVIGRMVEEHPGLVRRIAAEGHELCNHSFTHDSRLSDRPVGRIEHEVNRTRDAIDSAAPGAAVPYFRQPTMFVTDEVGAVTDMIGYRRLDWTIDTRDWTKPGADAIVASVTDRLRPGAIILLHDGGGDRSETVDALPRILDAIADAGLGIGLPE